MTTPSWLRLPALFVALVAVLLVTGCGRKRPLYAQPTALGGVIVRVYEARASDDQVWVKMQVTNETGQKLEIDRDGFALRLPDGRVLPRAVGVTTQHQPYVLEPEETRKVHVDFRSDEVNIEDVKQAWLILGGIRTLDQAEVGIIGEVALGETYVADTEIAAPPKGAPPPATPERPATPPPPPAANTVEIATIAVDLRGLDDDTFREIDGVRLDRELITRLVQDGYAVVALKSDPGAVVRVLAEDDIMVLEGIWPEGSERRTVKRDGVANAELHLELAHKASDLAGVAARRGTAAPPPPPAASEASLAPPPPPAN